MCPFFQAGHSPILVLLLLSLEATEKKYRFFPVLDIPVIINHHYHPSSSVSSSRRDQIVRSREKKHQNRQHNLQSSSLSLSSTAVRKVQKVLSQNVNYFIYVFNRLIDKSGSSGTVLFFSSSLPRHPENEEDTSPHNDKFKRERKKEMTEEKFFFLYHHHKSPVRRGRKKSTFIRVEILDGPSRPEM